jgi:hypothetical protein
MVHQKVSRLNFPDDVQNSLAALKATSPVLVKRLHKLIARGITWGHKSDKRGARCTPSSTSMASSSNLQPSCDDSEDNAWEGLTTHPSSPRGALPAHTWLPVHMRSDSGAGLANAHPERAARMSETGSALRSRHAGGELSDANASLRQQGIMDEPACKDPFNMQACHTQAVGWQAEQQLQYWCQPMYQPAPLSPNPEILLALLDAVQFVLEQSM